MNGVTMGDISSSRRYTALYWNNLDRPKRTFKITKKINWLKNLIIRIPLPRVYGPYLSIQRVSSEPGLKWSP